MVNAHRCPILDGVAGVVNYGIGNALPIPTRESTDGIFQRRWRTAPIDTLRATLGFIRIMGILLPCPGG